MLLAVSGQLSAVSFSILTPDRCLISAPGVKEGVFLVYKPCNQPFRFLVLLIADS
jgi:hypothetical protein